ncbi:MAG: hypothetical protein WD733_08055 [Bryobacterales bacterium]
MRIQGDAATWMNRPHRTRRRAKASLPNPGAREKLFELAFEIVARRKSGDGEE